MLTKNKLQFYVSKRLTKSGGLTKIYKDENRYEIGLSSSLLLNTDFNEKKRIVINGINCLTRLDATLSIFEHELIHLCEFLIFRHSNCSKPNFLKLAKNVFGHSGVTHNLTTFVETAYTKYRIKVGDSVFFFFKGIKYTGFISKITKRATVMVPDLTGEFIDRFGKRYKKFYIPLWLLNRTGHKTTL